jgi:hypothetical protein
MAVKRDLASEGVTFSADPEDLAIRRVQHTAIDKIGHGAPGLEPRIQGKPGLRPQQAIVDLRLDLLPDPVVLDIQKARNKGLIVRQNLCQAHRTRPRNPLRSDVKLNFADVTSGDRGASPSRRSRHAGDETSA